jgi:hypothetical protein
LIDICTGFVSQAFKYGMLDDFRLADRSGLGFRSSFTPIKQGTGEANSSPFSQPFDTEMHPTQGAASL